jgi:hypothetical protein
LLCQHGMITQGILAFIQIVCGRLTMNWLFYMVICNFSNIFFFPLSHFTPSFACPVSFHSLLNAGGRLVATGGFL